ncbi:hypothetical protein BDW69DRAFT_184138 [Aspergillus filifer]
MCRNITPASTSALTTRPSLQSLKREGWQPIRGPQDRKTFNDKALLSQRETRMFELEQDEYVLVERGPLKIEDGGIFGCLTYRTSAHKSKISDPFNFLGIYTENTPVNILHELDFPPLFPTINANKNPTTDANANTNSNPKTSTTSSTSTSNYKPQVINLGPCPAYNSQGIGIYATETNFTRPGLGTIREVINWDVAIFVKPLLKYWGPTMFYPLRVTDLFELEITQGGRTGVRGMDADARDPFLFPDPEPYASPIPVPEPGKIGYGIWLGGERNVMFGLGEIMQVARGAKVAIVKREVDTESENESENEGGGRSEGTDGKDTGEKPTRGFLSLGDRHQRGIELKFRWF